MQVKDQPGRPPAAPRLTLPRTVHWPCRVSTSLSSCEWQVPSRLKHFGYAIYGEKRHFYLSLVL